MSSHHANGEIRVTWDPPDLLIVTYRGDIGLDVMAKAVEASQPFIDGHAYHLAMLDVTHFGSMTSAARKLAVSSSEKGNVRGVAVIGASFHVQVLGGLLIRAMQLFYKGKDNPTEFFKTETDARVWLENRRRIVAGSREKTE